ncbi:MAG: hypothetical protein JSW25_00515 [Thermoplasmata archaeon]|nr:MAG: hypothetical protein JSW25_00515 [Thermoplasmata archaeon]
MADEKGELIAESSAQVTQLIRGRFRFVAGFFGIIGVLMILAWLILWLVLDVWWVVYIIFLAAGVLMLFVSANLLYLSVRVPSVRIYEGGVLVKPPKGKTVFHPWAYFKGYTMKEMGPAEVIELQPPDGEGISIHQYTDKYAIIKELVEANVPLVE